MQCLGEESEESLLGVLTGFGIRSNCAGYEFD
jgi:hypothetical protein